MWKRVFQTLVVIVLVAALGVLALLGWVSSSGFDRYVAGLIQRELTKLNIRAEIEQVDVNVFQGTAQIGPGRLFVGQQATPFFEFAHLQIKIRILDLFSRHFELNQLTLANPTVNLIFDEAGRSNLTGIDLSPLRKRRAPDEPDIEIGRIVIDDGAVVFNHQPSRVSGQAQALQIGVEPEQQATRLRVNSDRVILQLDQRRLDNLALELNVLLTRDGASIERGRIVNSFADALISGAVHNWSKPSYELSLASTVDLTQLMRQLSPAASLSGTAELNGKITGEEKEFRFKGYVAAPRLDVTGIRATELRFDGEGGTADAAPASDAAILEWQGSLQSRLIQVGFVQLEGFRGLVYVTPKEIEIRRFSATTLHGSVAGDATIALHGTSTVDATLRALNVRQAVTKIIRQQLPLDGRLSAQVRVQWPATNVGQLVGRARVSIEPPSPGAGEFLPVSGTADVDVTRRGLSVARSNIQLGSTQVTAAGTIAWNGAMDLQLDAEFENLAEQNRMLEALGVDLSQLTQGAVTALSGRGHFSGRIQGRGHQLTLAGTGTIRELDLTSGRLMAGQADVEYRAGVVTLTNTSATFDDGARIELVSFQTGAMQLGGLTLRGQINNLDVRSWMNRIGLSIPLTGAATGQFDLTGLPHAPRGRIDVTVVKGRLQPPQFTVAFDRLTATVLATETGYQIEQLKLERGPNIITLAGSYQPQSRAYSLTARGVDLDISRFDDELKARGYPLTGRFSFQLSGSGNLAEPALEGDFQLTGLTIAGKQAGTLRGELRAARGDIRWNVRSELFEQRQTLTGRLDLSDPAQPLSMHAHLTQLDATPYLRLLGAPEALGLTLSGEIELAYPLVFPERRRLTATLTQAQVAIGNFRLNNQEPLILSMQQSRVEVAPVRFQGDNTMLRLSGAVDVEPMMQRGGSLGQAQLNMIVEGAVNLQMLGAAYPGLFTGGQARLHTTIRGTLSQPAMSGTAEIENASARLVNVPLALAEGKGTARFTKDRLLLERFVGKVNDGQVSIDGGLLAREFQPQRWNFNIRAESVNVRYPDGWQSVLNGELQLQGSRQLQILSGLVNVQRAQYTKDVDFTQWLLGRAPWSGILPGSREAALPALALDIRLQATDSVFIRNNFVNAQSSAWLHLGGTLNQPTLSGRASIIQGTVELQNREYQINVGTFEFPASPNQELRFNIEAAAEISGYQVFLGFSGTPSRLKPTLRSEPPLPTEAVFALITTGRVDTATQTAQTATQSNIGVVTSLLSEALSQQLEQRIARQRFFGINRFQIEPLLTGSGADPTARITIGQQITKDLSVQYSINVASNEEPIVIVEYKLTDRFYLVGSRDEKGQFSIDVRLRRRF